MDGETNLKSQTRRLADCRGDDWFLEGRSSLNNKEERKKAQKTERKQQNNNVAYKYEDVSKGSIVLANF